jgi:protein-S-isoprenylcysteine O-methyltransferase Ste14
VKFALQTLASVVFGLLFFGLALFIPAGTFRYWEGWVFIAVFMLSTMIPSVYLVVRNPAALQRRMNAGPTAESRPAQRIIISATVLLVATTVVLSALDQRFGWTGLPLAVIIFGNVLVAVGLNLAQLVVVQNEYASANITVEADQPLVSTGLYGVVRHPMYTGTLIMMFGTPLALDSLWGLVPVFIAIFVLAARIFDEEKMLAEELAGYPEYMDKVRYRLVPYVW